MKKIEKIKCLGVQTPQRMRRFPCLQDCLLTLTCHLALFAKLYFPLRKHMKSVDVTNVVFSLKAYGPELDRNDTFATLFGPTAENVDLYIGYRSRRSGRTARLNYKE